MGAFLKRVRPDEIGRARRDPVDAETLARAAEIVEEVRRGGEGALRAYAEELDGLAAGVPLVVSRRELDAARDALGAEERALLERTAARVRAFAEAQLASLGRLATLVPGGRAGHAAAPVEVAGCYAPGGRFPLPSTVLMTVATARAAEVRAVWVASPRPAPITLAAASIAGADALLAAGGAQAIAAFAFGAGPVPRCDVIAGPGNRWVTAAKKLVAGSTGIDMLAGPSELVVVCDETADPRVVAADLLAQAEHDPDALPAIVALDEAIIGRVEAELSRQLEDLPTAATARAALEANGLAVLVGSREEAIAACDALAPEHLELHVAGAATLASRLAHYGALFIGSGAAEVLGDYGAGPNHVLPTGTASRFTGGLSALTFTRVRTWLEIDGPAGELAEDAAALARLEGLEAHARAAELRMSRRARTADGPWPISFDDVLAARARIRPHLAPTPLRAYGTLDEAAGNGIRVFVKHENHNPTNAFKARNGLALMTALTPEERARGVVAASRGNHGQALAWAGGKLGVPVTICVPIGNNPEKNAAIRAFGATVIEEGRDYDESVGVAARLVEERGLVMAHSTNDPRVIAGAATLTLEILEERPDVEAIVVAIGGGSQAVGALTVARALRPGVEVYGVQAAGASAIHDAFKAGAPLALPKASTFADGLATRQTYALTFDALCRGLADFVLASEAELAQAVRLYLTSTHNLAEGAGAAGLAGLMKLRDRLAGKNVAIILSGGNIDADTLAKVLRGDFG